MQNSVLSLKRLNADRISTFRLPRSGSIRKPVHSPPPRLVHNQTPPTTAPSSPLLSSRLLSSLNSLQHQCNQASRRAHPGRERRSRRVRRRRPLQVLGDDARFSGSDAVVVLSDASRQGGGPRGGGGRELREKGEVGGA